jgi:signal transduction histidine kinase
LPKRTHRSPPPSGARFSSWRFGLVAAVGIALHLRPALFTPIKALHSGTAGLATGDLGRRISIRTGAELQDLGEQFNAMAARLQASYADLERKVAERTRELEEANLAKTRFLAVASHDLRQPLHALGLFIGQLNTPRDAADLQRIVERAEACIAGMNELFDGLLDISRIDTQQLSPNVAHSQSSGCSTDLRRRTLERHDARACPFAWRHYRSGS